MKIDNKYPKTYPLNNKKIKLVAFMYLMFSLIMILSIFLLKEVIIIFAIIGPILFLLSGYIYLKCDKINQLEIHSEKLYFNEKRNFGKSKFQDFYNFIIKNQLENINISEITEVQLEDSILQASQLSLLLKNGRKITLLLNSTNAELIEISHDLKVIIDEKNTNF